MMIKSLLSTLILTLIGTLTLTPEATSQDWPQWRGPTRDGSATSFSEPAVWPEQLTKQWTVSIGQGYATPILIGEQIYTYTRQGQEEVVMALDAKSGDILCRTAYPAKFNMNRATANHGPGPKSTPVFHDGRLFTLGISGIVTAFDAKTCNQLWQKPALPTEPLYHTAMSPVVEDDIVIFHVGGHDDGALTAFDITTGDVRWSWNGDGPAYGSPVVFNLEGTRQVVTFTQENLVGVSTATGELLWSRPFTTPSTTTSQTPILHKNLVIQAGRGNGITAFRVVKRGDNWDTENVWHNDEVSLHMTNGVVVDGILVGLSHLNSGQYFGLELDTGHVLWTGAARQAENASIVKAGSKVISLQNDAELIVLDNIHTGFKPVQSYEVASSETWSQPVISGKRLFVKDFTTLTLWTVE